MAFEFDEGAISGVLRHMNTDHKADNLLIARAFGAPDATASVMTGFNGDQAFWTATTPEGEVGVVVSWPSGSISERPEIRREVVAVYLAACEALGVTPRDHD